MVRQQIILQRQRQYEAAILEAVDAAFLEFGGSTSEILYFHLARSHSIRREEVPKRFGDFILALREEFGSGGKTLEALILEKLYSKLGANSQGFQKAALTLVLVPEAVKENLE